MIKELKNNNLSIFAGAGLSRGSGFVDWRGLLSEIATELELDINKELDLVSVAQYHFNDNGRQTINEAIVNEFQQSSEKNENMNILSRLPINTYWTTNYDSIIEDTLNDSGKIVDKKIRPGQMKTFTPNRDVVVYKMHGDKEDPDDAVITRDDYENYNSTRTPFTTQLKGELISKTFLFIGFSFEDPNLEQILSRIRVDLLGASPKNHYCFFRKVNRSDEHYKNDDGTINDENFKYDIIKQKLKIRDLKRYGINSVLIDEYSEITSILQNIEKKFKLNKIFISGSAHEYGEYTELDAKSLMHNLSKNMVKENNHIISGFGIGVGSFIINGALEEIFQSKGKKINDFLTLRPFPQIPSGDKDLKTLWTEYRKEMLSEAGTSIFIFGNKLKDGEIVDADGIIEEYQIARGNNHYIIPIGSTGYIAEKIFNEIKNEIESFPYLEDSLDVLYREKDIEKIITEIKNILGKISRLQ